MEEILGLGLGFSRLRNKYTEEDIALAVALDEERCRQQRRILMKALQLDSCLILDYGLAVFTSYNVLLLMVAIAKDDV